MYFIEPGLKKVYESLKNNNKLTKYLTEKGALITKDAYNKINEKISIDPDEAIYFTEIENKKTLENLAEVIYNNSKEIENRSINNLATKRFLSEEIKEALGFDETVYLNTDFFREIYYDYKTSFVENFFQNNYENFIPETDFEQMDDATIAFLEAISKEFDKLDNIITESKKFQSYDEIPFEYINYLTQLLGFEQATLFIDATMESQFRTLAKNILDVYACRGTEASFELLFRFLGLDIKLAYCYFDRRYYLSSKETNEEFGSKNKNSYKYYLTTNNPADNIPEYFPIEETVSENNFCHKYRLENFDDLVKECGSVECVLGYDDTYLSNNKTYYYDKEVYTYFKTNLVRVIPSVIDGKENMSLNQLYMLSALLNFLTPAFWQRDIVVTAINDKNKEEKMTLNGPKTYHFNDEGMLVMDEGFRMFDSERQIVEGATPTKDEEKKLNYIKNSLYYDVNKDKHYFLKDCYYVDSDNDNYRFEYVNSVGETEGNVTEGGRVNNLEAVNEPIGSTIAIKNTTAYWGAKVNLGETKTKKYKIFESPTNKKNSIYIPAQNNKDIYDSWKKIPILNLNSFEGNTLKKFFLNENNKVEIEYTEKSISKYVEDFNSFEEVEVSNFKELKEIGTITGSLNLKWLKDNFNIANYDYINDKLIRIKNEELSYSISDDKKIAELKADDIISDILKASTNETNYIITENIDGTNYTIWSLIKNNEINFKPLNNSNLNISKDENGYDNPYYKDTYKELLNTENVSIGKIFKVIKENRKYISTKEPKEIEGLISNSTPIAPSKENLGKIRFVHDNSSDEENIPDFEEALQARKRTMYMVKQKIDKKLIFSEADNQLYKIENDFITNIIASELLEPSTTTNYKNGKYIETPDCEKVNKSTEYILGIKPIELHGEIKKIDEKYYICAQDPEYKGLSEQDDDDNYILNNYSRDIYWDIFDGCDETLRKKIEEKIYPKNIIKRPVKIITDKLLDENINNDDNGKTFIFNVLDELLTDLRFIPEYQKEEGRK